MQSMPEKAVAQPDAADDFASIRARMEELKRAEAKQADAPDPPVPRQLMVDRPDTPPAIRRFLMKHGREKGLF